MGQRERTPAIVPFDTELPPPPPGVRYVRVPLLGIVISDDDVRAHIDRRFHWPMIIAALLVLPVLLVDLLYLVKHPEHEFTVIWWLCVSGSSAIWLAFLIEFVVKVAIAESRFEYCKRNWLDIVIIAAPMVGWLRLSRLARTTRVFRLRGVGMKFGRYALSILLGLNATERLLGRFGIKLGRYRRDPERMTRHQLMDEVRTLRRLTDAWDAWYDQREEYDAEHGPTPISPRPYVTDDGADDAVAGEPTRKPDLTSL